MSNADLLAQQRDYLQTYSLKSEPFSNTPDGRFFYAGTALMQRLDLLIHLTQFGDSVVLVSGPEGSGKTTLLSRFAAQATRQWRLCPLNGDEFDQFPRLMAKALRVDEVADELEMLQSWASETDNSQLLVILIDKAEALPESAVAVLLKLLACSVRERLRLILFGTPEAQKKLKKILDSSDLPGSSQVLEVPRLSEEETSAYLMYRLAVAGYSGESPFTATEVRGICKAAQGRPGAINLLAHDTLMEQQARKRGKRVSATASKPKLGTAAWVPMTLVVVALATYLGWQRLQPEPETVAPPIEPAISTEPVPLAVPEPMPLPEPKKPRVPQVTRTPLHTAPSTAEPVPEAAVDKVPKAITEAITASIDTPAPADDTAAKTTADATGMVAAGVTASPEQESGTPPAIPARAATEAAPPAEKIAVVADESATEPADIIDEKQPEPAATKAETGPDGQGPHREAWLLAQQGKKYSLQLLGSRSEKSVVEYIKKYRLDPAQSAYYLGKYRGDNWYVLMYGIYPDRQTALGARADLPAAVRKAKPWPRDLASVHKAINEINR